MILCQGRILINQRWQLYPPWHAWHRWYLHTHTRTQIKRFLKFLIDSISLKPDSYIYKFTLHSFGRHFLSNKCIQSLCSLERLAKSVFSQRQTMDSDSAVLTSAGRSFQSCRTNYNFLRWFKNSNRPSWNVCLFAINLSLWEAYLVHMKFLWINPSLP